MDAKNLNELNQRRRANGEFGNKYHAEAEGELGNQSETKGDIPRSQNFEVSANTEAILREMSDYDSDYFPAPESYPSSLLCPKVSFYGDPDDPFKMKLRYGHKDEDFLIIAPRTFNEPWSIAHPEGPAPKNIEDPEERIALDRFACNAYHRGIEIFNGHSVACSVAEVFEAMSAGAEMIGGDTSISVNGTEL